MSCQFVVRSSPANLRRLAERISVRVVRRCVLEERVQRTMTERPLWKTLLAFGMVYFVWGSTFLAIRG